MQPEDAEQEPEDVERLAVADRPDAYLAAHRVLQERLGLAAP